MLATAARQGAMALVVLPKLLLDFEHDSASERAKSNIAAVQSSAEHVAVGVHGNAIILWSASISSSCEPMKNVLRVRAIGVWCQFKNRPAAGRTATSAAEIGCAIEISRGIKREAIERIRSISACCATDGKGMNDGLRHAPSRPRCQFEHGAVTSAAIGDHAIEVVGSIDDQAIPGVEAGALAIEL